MLFSPTGIESQRLLPASLEDRIVGLLGRVVGAVLLATVALLWVSVLSWTVSDPSLTHATGGEPRNVLGAIGAIMSDLMLQTLGFAATIALLAPMLWGLELVQAERVLGFRAKAAYFPLAVLMLAGALSSLPSLEIWPFRHGYGGLLGDAVLRLASSLLAVVNPDRAGVAAGMVLMAAGVSSLSLSVGVQLKELWEMVRGLARMARFTRRQAVGPVGGSHYFARAELAATANPYADSPTTRSYPETAAWDDRAWTGGHGAPSMDVAATPPPRNPPDRMMLQNPYASEPEPAVAYDQSAVATRPTVPWTPPLDLQPDQDRLPRFLEQFRPDRSRAAAAAPRGREFDRATDDASCAIASRFAPNAASAPQSATPPLEASEPRASVAVTEAAQPQGRARSGLMGGFGSRKVEAGYRRPSLNMLKRAPAARPGPEFTQNVLRGNARLLEDVLADFGIKGEVRDTRPGPVVTLFEVEPARGTKSSRVISLADDIARSMSATAVRVAVVPGRNAIGIELPNVRRESVLLREILESEAFRSSQATLPIALGKSISGEAVVADLARMPHLLVAGTTGSGKSVGVNAMILSLLYRHAPEDCRFLMIDPKMLELSVYNGIPHLLTPVVTDPQKAVNALNWVVAEMEERYKRMSKLNVRNIDVFNNRVRNAKKRGEMMSRTVQTGFDKRTGQAIYEQESLTLEPMPYIVVVIDEFADLMVVAGKEIEAAVQRLAQMARAAGIHLVMATQRPSVDVITGTIKANFPTRISFKVASKIDSRTILGDQGAEQLLGAGDMLFASGAGQAVRVHGPFVADEEVETISQFLRQQGEPQYIDAISERSEPDLPGDGPEARGASDDELFDRAVAVVLRDRKASTSYIQRRLSIGYNRAADLIERMEREGLIGPANNVGKREILTGAAGGMDAA